MKTMVFIVALLPAIANGFYLAPASEELNNLPSKASVSNINSFMLAPPVWEYDFEKGWQATDGRGSLKNQSSQAKKWRYSQMQGDDSGRVVVDPEDPNNHVMQFIWYKSKGTEYDSNTQKKAHLYGFFGQTNKEEEIWSFRVYFPKQGMEKDNKSEIITQWHGFPDAFESARKPPLSLDNRKDQLTVTWLYDQRKFTPPWSRNWDSHHLSLGKTPKDQWIHFVFHIKWNPDGSGLLRVWQDGVLKINQPEIAIGFNDQVGAYLGFGIYKFENKSQHNQRRILFDDFKHWLVKPQ